MSVAELNSKMSKPLYKVGDKVLYISMTGFKEAVIQEVMRSRNNFAYRVLHTYVTEWYRGEPTKVESLSMAMKEEDLFHPIKKHGSR